MKLTKSIETKLNIYQKSVKKLIITNNLKKKTVKLFGMTFMKSYIQKRKISSPYNH